MPAGLRIEVEYSEEEESEEVLVIVPRTKGLTPPLLGVRGHEEWAYVFDDLASLTEYRITLELEKQSRGNCSLFVTVNGEDLVFVHFNKQPSRRVELWVLASSTGTIQIGLNLVHALSSEAVS